MRTALATLALASMATFTACGTGGGSPQPPPTHPGDPWFELRSGVAGQINPGNFWGYSGIPQPWYCGFVLQDQNQDGNLDVVLVTRDAEASYQPTGWVFQGDGALHFGMNGYPVGDTVT